MAANSFSVTKNDINLRPKTKNNNKSNNHIIKANIVKPDQLILDTKTKLRTVKLSKSFLKGTE